MKKVTNTGSFLFYFMQDVSFLLDSMKWVFIFHTVGIADIFHPSLAIYFKTFEFLKSVS